MALMKCILPWWGMYNSKRKNADSLESAFSWQGQKDSNPQQRFWRPTCYHYTMPLRTRIIIPGYGQKVKQNFCFFGNRAAGAEAVVLGRVNNRYKLARMARKRLTNAPLYVYNSMTG